MPDNYFGSLPKHWSETERDLALHPPIEPDDGPDAYNAPESAHSKELREWLWLQGKIEELARDLIKGADEKSTKKLAFEVACLASRNSEVMELAKVVFVEQEYAKESVAAQPLLEKKILELAKHRIEHPEESLEVKPMSLADFRKGFRD